MVVAISDVARQFVLRYRASCFRTRRLCTLEPPSRTGRTGAPSGGETGVLSGAGFAETLDLALQLHPSTERVFVVAESPNGTLADTVRDALREFEPRVELVYVAATSVSESHRGRQGRPGAEHRSA